jgi:hypothetical protein
MRMSWAAHRQTTRVEDTAYCLLGIFDVNMPLMYSEGMKAFRRLQEAIVKRRNDLTIFSWNALLGQETQMLSLFAASPEAFVDGTDIVPFSDDFSDFSVTNKGLLMSGDIPMRIAVLSGGNGGPEILRYLIVLGTRRGRFEWVGIYLRKVGPKLFFRDGMFPLAVLGLNEVEQKGIIEAGYHILIDPHRTVQFLFSRHRDGALHIPNNDVFSLTSTVPESLWDHTDRIFLRPNPYHSLPWSSYPMVLAMKFQFMLSGMAVNIVVLCDYREAAPTCKVFEASSQAGIVFLGRHRNDSITWEELELQAPDILSLNNRMEIRCRDRIYTGQSHLRKATLRVYPSKRYLITCLA